ncbi:MAG TPA: aminotransferase class V-fold PLP-dependent enzyme, partial [Chromatiaceae bacterium]|nr:aminotransferase class V-fold PLP-dependent enzyme [Chromatiaceae bacterium]
MKLPIYMDYSATTPVDPRVAEKMCACLTLEGNFGNAASRSHAFGWAAEDAVEEARQQVADLINADPKEIVWTSGATESDNLAIKGAAHFYQKR